MPEELFCWQTAGLNEESRANGVRPYGDNLVPLEKGDVPKGQGDYPSGTQCHRLD